MGTSSNGSRSSIDTLRGVGVAVCLGVSLALLLATDALALSGTTIKVAEPAEFKSPAVAVNEAGTAFIAWINDTDLGGKGNTIEYCVLPAGATACAHSGSLIPEGAKEPVVEQVQVLSYGATAIVLDQVYGVPTAYLPTQEWQSSNGGATFAAVDGGKSVADGILSADTDAVNAVVVPGTEALGYGWNTTASLTEGFGNVPTFDEFPLTNPPTCNPGASDYPPACPTDEYFAALQPDSSPYQVGGHSGQYASELAPSPGILAVFETDFNNGPFCGGVFGTAYAYASGDQSAGNSYDISPGEPKSAWRKAITPGDCEADDIAVGGGPSGLGVVEKDLTRGYEVYHRFNQTTESFEPSTATIAEEGGADASVSQDGAGGVYVTFIGNSNDAIDLAYSSTGGSAWTGPAELNPNTDLGASSLTSSVGTNGQGWAVWTDKGSVYAQQFDAGDATPVATPISSISPPPPPPTPKSTYTIKTIVVNSNGTVTITFVPTQSGEATLVVTVPTASIASASAVIAKAKKCKHGQVSIKGKCLPSNTVSGKTSAHGTAGVPLKLTVHLSSKVKALLDEGRTEHLTATLTYASSLGGKATVHTYHLTIKGVKHKKK